MANVLPCMPIQICPQFPGIWTQPALGRGAPDGVNSLDGARQFVVVAGDEAVPVEIIIHVVVVIATGRRHGDAVSATTTHGDHLLRVLAA